MVTMKKLMTENAKQSILDEIMTSLTTSDCQCLLAVPIVIGILIFLAMLAFLLKATGKWK